MIINGQISVTPNCGEYPSSSVSWKKKSLNSSDWYYLLNRVGCQKVIRKRKKNYNWKWILIIRSIGIWVLGSGFSLIAFGSQACRKHYKPAKDRAIITFIVRMTSIIINSLTGTLIYVSSLLWILFLYGKNLLDFGQSQYNSLNISYIYQTINQPKISSGEFHLLTNILSLYESPINNFVFHPELLNHFIRTARLTGFYFWCQR